MHNERPDCLGERRRMTLSLARRDRLLEVHGVAKEANPSKLKCVGKMAGSEAAALPLAKPSAISSAALCKR